MPVSGRTQAFVVGGLTSSVPPGWPRRLGAVLSPPWLLSGPLSSAPVMTNLFSLMLGVSDLDFSHEVGSTLNISLS